MLQALKKINSTAIQKLLVATLIFSIPSNLFKTFFVDSAYVRGLQVDYLIPKIYLNDLILFLLLLSLLAVSKNRIFLNRTIKKFFQKQSLLLNILLLQVLVVIFVLFQFTTAHPLVAVLFTLRIALLIITGLVVKNNTQLLTSKVYYISISTTIIFQSLLAWYQYLQQKSFSGYYFLGETNLSAYTGIARTSLYGAEKILPYGTTAHPNILAGILTTFSLFHINKMVTQKKVEKINILILLVSISTIILTQSTSALIALLVGTFSIYLIRKHKVKFSVQKILQIFLVGNMLAIIILAFTTQKPQFESTSITRRAYLNSAALDMSLDNKLTGVGLHNFTAYVEKYSNNQEVVRFVQPVHNVLLLFLAETGLLGIAIGALLLKPILKKNIQHSEYLIALMPLLILDHYLFTIQSGTLLVWFLFLVVTTKN